jgi:hypothetical protein
MRSPALEAAATRPDYTLWSIEELWALATQLRISGARAKTRRELVELFVGPVPKRP